MYKSSSTKLLFLVITPLLFLISSCNDFDPITELNGTRADIIAMLQFEDITQQSSIPSDNFRFLSEKMTVVTAEPNSFIFEDSGILATGMIDFEMTELFTKSEILQYGIETKSLNSILESDGEFLFSASQNGKPLQLANDKALRLEVPNSNPNPSMGLFVAGEGTWLPTDNPLNVFVSGNQTSFSVYNFFVDRLEWINIDYFMKFDLALTDISISLPEGYQDDKISLWIVFRDIDVVLNSKGENLPIGEVVSIVCIAAEDEDNFRIDIKEVTIEEGLKVNLNPKRKSAEKIKNLLKELD